MYKLSPLSWNKAQSTSVINLAKMCAIPFDPANTDYKEYLKWLAEGNTPLPADTIEENK